MGPTVFMVWKGLVCLWPPFLASRDPKTPPRFDIEDYGLCSGPLHSSIDRLQILFPKANTSKGENSIPQLTAVQPANHEWIYVK